MDTADRIFYLLDKLGMEQKAFAVAIGTTDKTVSTWRTGRTKSFQKYLPTIAAVLGTTVDYLVLGEKKEPAPVSGDEPLDPMTAQLMEFVRRLTPDQKSFLLAQMKTMLENQ